MRTKRKPKPKRKPSVGIHCPECGSASKALYSRPRGMVTFRRRECTKCRERFTTCERIVNRGTPESSIDRTQFAMTMRDLFRVSGLTVADLESPLPLTSEEKQ